MKYTTAMIWNLASLRGEGHCYINQEGYKIRFNGEYFSEYCKGKVYGVAITKVCDVWEDFNEKTKL